MNDMFWIFSVYNGVNVWAERKRQERIRRKKQRKTQKKNDACKIVLISRIYCMF